MNAADSFHTKKLLVLAECDFTRKMDVLRLGATPVYDVPLRLIGKHVVDVPLVLIELFSAVLTAEAVRAKIDRQSAF